MKLYSSRFLVVSLTIVLSAAVVYLSKSASSHRVLRQNSPLETSVHDAHRDLEEKTISKSEYLGDQPSFQTSKKIDLSSIREVLELDRKVLKRSNELSAYRDSLQNSELIETARKALSQIEEPQSRAQLLEKQQERMDAALFLTRALEWRENPETKRIKFTMKSLILDDTVENAKNLDLKKSLIADRIELFANLKSIDRAYGLSIQQQATKTSSKN